MINCYGTTLEMISITGNSNELLDEYARIRNVIYRIYRKEEVEKAVEKYDKAMIEPPGKRQSEISKEAAQMFMRLMEVMLDKDNNNEGENTECQKKS